MTGQGGEWTVNSHLFCFCTFNWAFGNGIINMQLQSPRECAGEVRPCVRVCACVSHYSFVSPEWVVAIQALCVQSERRREAHLHMRSQIIHLTLRQEGSTERRRAKLKESEEKKGKKKGESEREMMREKQTTEWMVWTAKGQEEAACTEGKQWWERVRLWERTGEMEWKRKWGRDSGRMLLCFSYQAGRAILLPAALQWAVEGLVLQWWP